MQIVAVVGAATALFAGTIGLVQHDIKRVLAYSTVSQLGYMFLAMGVGAFSAGIFHLYTHAFFKALLFLGSGAVIHALHGEQDIRRMGGLRRELPLTYWTFVVGALAIAGVPGLSGFFSKDEILFRTFAGGHVVLWAIGVGTSLLTAVYMFRLVFLTFHGERAQPPPAAPHTPAAHHGPGAHGGPGAGGHLHDAPPAMAAALVVLALGSVVAGYVGVPHALGGHNRIGTFLEPSFHPAAFQREGLPGAGWSGGAPGEVRAGEAHAAAPGEHAAGGPGAAAHDPAAEVRLERTLMLVSSAVALGGIALAAFFFLKRRDRAEAVARRFPGLYRLLLNKYWVDELYDAVFVHPIQRLSETVLWQRVDAGLIDGAVNGAGAVVRSGAAALRQAQTGSVRAYAASLFLGVLLVIAYYLAR
jgi:NADH-quinone oxidoreductase subunit L